MPVDIEHPAPVISAHLHAGDVAEINGDAVARSERDRLDIAGRRDEAATPHDKFKSVFLERAAADVEVVLRDRVKDLGKRNAEFLHSLTETLHLPLADEAANPGDF